MTHVSYKFSDIDAMSFSTFIEELSTLVGARKNDEAQKDVILKYLRKYKPQATTGHIIKAFEMVMNEALSVKLEKIYQLTVMDILPALKAYYTYERKKIKPIATSQEPMQELYGSTWPTSWTAEYIAEMREGFLREAFYKPYKIYQKTGQWTFVRTDYLYDVLCYHDVIKLTEEDKKSASTIKLKEFNGYSKIKHLEGDSDITKEQYFAYWIDHIKAEKIQVVL